MSEEPEKPEIREKPEQKCGGDAGHVKSESNQADISENSTGAPGLPADLVNNLQYQRALVAERYADVVLQIKTLQKSERLLADALVTINDQLNLRSPNAPKMGFLAGIPLKRA